MKKIVLVIGSTASGKTTFVKESFIQDKELKNFLKPVKHCLCDKTLLIGNYGIGKECEGADTLPFNALYKVIEFIKQRVSEFELLICEGERLTCRAFFEFIAGLNIPVDLYEFQAELETIKERKSRRTQRWQGRKEYSESFIKTTITKAKNHAVLGEKLGFNVIRRRT